MLFSRFLRSSNILREVHRVSAIFSDWLVSNKWFKPIYPLKISEKVRELHDD